jgi:cytochrome c-type biogenesis protein CcmH/NrfG
MRLTAAHGVVALLLTAGPRPSSSPAAAPDPPADVPPARQCVDLPKDAGVAACRAALSLGLSPRRAAVLREVLASKLAALGRWEEVVTVYREAAAQPAAGAGTYVRLGSALVHGVGRPEEALPWLREAARLGPADPEPWGVLGAALSALGRSAEAADAFDEAVRRDPSWLDSHPASRAIAEAARRGEGWP